MQELAILASLVAGWRLMGRVARERCLPTRLAGAVALGSLVATALTNLAMRVLDLPDAALAATAGAVLLWFAGRAAPRPRMVRLRPPEILVLGGVLVAAAWFVSLHLLRRPDGDYFIHMANWGLLASGHYPPVNPFLAGVPMMGHVARDVLIAWASAGAETPFPALRLLAVLWQLSALTLLYFGVRRYGGGPLAAVAATALALLATSGGFPDFRTPALHTLIDNNNPLVHACLFLLMGLTLKACYRPDRSLALLAGMALGTFALVYETHFAALVLALPLSAAGARRRAMAIAGIAVALAAVQGGLLTDLASRTLHLRTEATAPAAATQAVSLQGLKPLALTSPNSREFPLLSLRFLRAQNLGWWLLPLTVVGVRGNRYGRLALAVGLVAVGIPALLDLGRFNVEALRLVFLAGVAFAVALGCAVGALTPTRWQPLVLALGAVAVALAGTPTLRLHYNELWRLDRQPGVFVLDPRAQAVQQAAHPQFTEVDVRALLRLRQEARRGERVAANPAPLTGVPSSLDQVPKFLATVVGLARVPVTGPGTRPDRDTRDQNPFLVGYGYRGIALWSTLDPALADDLQADWLYILEENLAAGPRHALETEPRLREVARFEGRRLVRVEPRSLSDLQPLPPHLAVEIPALPPMEPHEFREIAVTIRNRGEAATEMGGLVWEPEIVDGASRVVNEGDRVRTRLPEGLLPPGGARQVPARLVAPSVPGLYRWAGAEFRVTR